MIKIIATLILLLITYTTSVFALDFTFPIAELGNCNSIKTCKVYCDQEENRATCIAFAKAKGVYKETISEQKVRVLEAAKQELGCSSIISCRAICEQEENWSKCQAFAKKHGLSSTDPNEEQLLLKAKQNLNCNSFEECRTLCDQRENYTKCAALMQDQITSDERDMFEKYKPQIKEFLGCDSIVTCMAFCMNPLNTTKCTEFGNKIGEMQGRPTYSDDPKIWCPQVSPECSWDGTNCVCQGPQTCAQANDIEGCTWDGTQCNCPGIAEDPPEIWCPKAGPGCAWDGKYCICPGTSETPLQTGEQESGEVWCPRIGPYCVWDGSSCTCWDDCVISGGIWNGSSCTPKQESPEIWCAKIGQYCVWDGSSCTCWDDCVKAGGTWTGQKCEYQGGTTEPKIEQISEPPEVSCTKNPDCKWTGETCQCSAVVAPQPEPTPAVQGATTIRTLLQQILDLIFGR